MIKKAHLLYNLLFTVLLLGLFVSRNPSSNLPLILAVFPLPLYFLKLLLTDSPATSKRRSAAVQPSVVAPTLRPLNRRQALVQTQQPVIIQNITHHHHAAPPPPQPALEPEVLSKGQVRDVDRRLFLKLIGSAGLTAFMFSIFSDKAHAAFFGSMPGPGTISIKDIAGNKIDPAEKQPTDGYNISQVDDIGPTNYYGFSHKTGAWYIQKEDNSGNYRYVKGTSDFATNWTNRAALSYDYFDNIF